MRPILITLLSILSLAPLATGQIKFGDDLAASQEAAKKERTLVLVFLADKESDDCKKMEGEFGSNAKLATVLGRKFESVRILAEIEANKAVFKRFDAKRLPVFVVLDSEGKILDRTEGYQEAARFTAWIDAMIELQLGLTILDKPDKTKPTQMVAALRKVGAVITDRSYAVLVEWADNDELSESIRKAAIEGLGKQKFGPEKLLGFLTHRNLTLRSAATNTMRQQGQAAVGALIEGLSSDNVDQRLACWTLLAPLNRDQKLIRDANFWKSAKAEDREKAVIALRESSKSKKE